MKSKKTLCNSFLIFSKEEIDYCNAKSNIYQSLTGIFSGKEAFIKAVSAFNDLPQYSFTDITVSHKPNGRPMLILFKKLNDYFEINHLCIDISISHTDNMAGATVIIYKKNYKINE
jgi:phosphopantetheine--protein transferase-like protein